MVPEANRAPGARGSGARASRARRRRLFSAMRLSVAVSTIAFLGLAGCGRPEAVRWSGGVEQPGESLPGKIVVSTDGGARFVDRLRDADSFPPPAGACHASVRVARSAPSGTERHAVWWSARADSSAVLLAAKSTDAGASWSAPIPVDTVDRSDVGCSRPAPAIAADSATSTVHIAYSMEGPEGTGVFFAHSMEAGDMYHWPVAVVYGERLVDVAVAVLRDTVAVAYADPNMRTPRIALALSRTMGHIFEERATVPGGASRSASSPDVALAPGRIVVGWVERAPTGPGLVVARTGALRMAATRGD